MSRPIIRSKRVVMALSNAAMRASSAAMREVLVTANTVNMMPLKRMGTPIAKYSWTLSISRLRVYSAQSQPRLIGEPPSGRFLGRRSAGRQGTNCCYECPRRHAAEYHNGSMTTAPNGNQSRSLQSSCISCIVNPPDTAQARDRYRDDLNASRPGTRRYNDIAGFAEVCTASCAATCTGILRSRPMA